MRCVPVCVCRWRADDLSCWTVSILALSLLSSPLPLPFVLPPYFSGSSIYQLTSLSKSIFGSRQRRTIRPSVGWSVTRLKRAELRPIGFPFGSSNFFVRYFPVCVCFRFPPRDLKASPLFFLCAFHYPLFLVYLFLGRSFFTSLCRFQDPTIRQPRGCRLNVDDQDEGNCVPELG